MLKKTVLLPLILSTLFAAPAMAQMRNGLPPTTMDSFVYEAKEYAEFIYGDEGVDGIPPYFEFTKASRINAGIMDTRDQGLTTGHGSYMPDAWGRDEFLGAEWSQSGARGRTDASGFSQDGQPTFAPPPTVAPLPYKPPFKEPGDSTALPGRNPVGGKLPPVVPGTVPNFDIPGVAKDP
jgi:hypothetical protein